MTEITSKVVEEVTKNEVSSRGGESVDPDKRIDTTKEANTSGEVKDVDPDERIAVDSGKSDKAEGVYKKDVGVDKNGNGVQEAEQAKTTSENDDSKKKSSEQNDVEKKRMEPPVEIAFKCPEGVDPEVFKEQLKRQERGLNSQTIAENVHNREAYEARKAETGNGRDPEGTKAQEIARQKAFQSRIESNQKKGMSYADAKAEAETWIKGQAALHNPDQIAGGNPTKVSGMGDANVNSSIGSQWRSRVGELKEAIDAYSEGKSSEELANTKLNVKLVMEDNSNGTAKRNA